MKNGRAESATADTIGPSATMDRELEWEIRLIIGILTLLIVFGHILKKCLFTLCRTLDWGTT